VRIRCQLKLYYINAGNFGGGCVQRHLWAQAYVSGAAAPAAVRGTYPQRTDGLSGHGGNGHQPPKRKPNGITRAEREARKSDDLLKRDFSASEPLKKCVTDITEIKARDGKLYVSAIFDCFDSAVPGLAMDTTRRAGLC